MEKSQNQLGLGILGFTTLLIVEELGKVEILRKLSEVLRQIFLDLHYEILKLEELVTSFLGKKFNTAAANVKRD